MHQKWNESFMKPLKIILFIITLILFMTIYQFSDRTADESNQDSIGFLVRLGLVTQEDVDNKTPEFQKLHSTVRTFAHFTLYALLALSLYLFFYVMSQRILGTAVITWLIVVFWAVLDERHQILVEGRGYELLDVYVDAFGGLITVVTAAIVSFILRMIDARKKDMKSE